MAKCRLILYKDTKLIPDKNFSFNGSIGDYLLGKSFKLINDFQYQRLELEKTIRVNLSQNEQILSNDQTLSNRYDYCCIIPMNGVATQSHYFYFIVKTTQISQSTIEYQLVMDTLNTFTFLTTFNTNLGYTLSPKTLVKREHKDRMHKIGGSSYYIQAPLNESESELLEDFKNHVISTDVTKSIVFELALRRIPTSGTIIFSFTWDITPLTGISLEVYSNGVLSTFANSGLSYNAIKITSNVVCFHNTSTNTDGPTLFFRDSYDWNVSHLIVRVQKIFSAWDVDTGTNYELYETWNNKLLPYKMVDKSLMYVRDIYEFQEGLGTILFKKNEVTLYDKDEGNQWYVVYASSAAVTQNPNDANPIYINPVQVRFYSDKGYSIATSSSHEVRLYATSSVIPKWKNTAEYLKYDVSPAPAAGTQYVKISGTTYDFHDYNRITLKRKNNNDIYFSISIIRRADGEILEFSNIESVIFYGINTLLCVDDWYKQSTYVYIGSGSGSYSGSCDSWINVNLTDERLIKAFAFPYAPCEFLVGKESFGSLPDGVVFSTDNTIELNVQQAPLFNYMKVFNEENPQLGLLIKEVNIAAGVARNIKYESKLYHSDYYQPKFVYDSFAFSFNLENVNAQEYINDPTFESFSVNYVVSQNIQSKFMFGFPQYVLKKSTQDYDNVLTIERNNEKALFNNAYINYVKSGGYAYDQKKASSQNAVNGVTTALSIVGSVGSFVAGAASGNPMGIAAGIGLAVGATTGIIRSVHTAQEQDRAIAQKVMQSQMQGTSVQGSEDIDILSAISGNKAKIVYYELSDIMKQAMWDLFHYCGYATHEQKIPDITTRLYFNFVQAEIVFSQYKFNEDIAEDIKNKWNEGITFIHKVSGSYDLDQQYENFETSLM